MLDTIPAGDLISSHAEGALTLSATAVSHAHQCSYYLPCLPLPKVEHAFKRWSTGEYEKNFEGFSAALSEKTATYLGDIEGVSEKGWAKIMAAARGVLNEKPSGRTEVRGSSVALSHASLRRQIVDADDD